MKRQIRYQAITFKLIADLVMTGDNESDKMYYIVDTKEMDTTIYTLKNDTDNLFNELRKDNGLKSECKYKVRFFIGKEECIKEITISRGS